MISYSNSQTWLRASFGLIFFVHNLSFACECIPASDEEQFCRAQNVVLGQVVTTFNTYDPTLPFESYASSMTQTAQSQRMTIAEIIVKHIFKGSPTSRTFVFTSGTASACAVKLDSGDPVLLNISPSGSVTTCGGNVVDINVGTPQGLAAMKRHKELEDKWKADAGKFCEKYLPVIQSK
ncbi:hypothetical protein AAKU67_004065 [Oxalobacteraceae bacterium GrIS 2.11]